MQPERSVSAVEFIDDRVADIKKSIAIDKTIYSEYDIKRGLRNADGTGVMAGVTRINQSSCPWTSARQKTESTAVQRRSAVLFLCQNGMNNFRIYSLCYYQYVV